MVSYTTPLNIPKPDATDTVKAALVTVLPAMAEQIDDLITALSAVAPTAWADAPLATGWTGNVRYKRLAGIVVVNMPPVLKATWAVGDLIATFPVGFRPSEAQRGMGQSGGALRGVVVNPDGTLKSDFNTGTGIYGTFAYAL